MKTVAIAILLLLAPVIFAGCSVEVRTKEEQKEIAIPELSVKCKETSLNWTTIKKCEIEGRYTCIMYHVRDGGGVWCERL